MPVVKQGNEKCQSAYNDCLQGKERSSRRCLPEASRDLPAFTPHNVEGFRALSQTIMLDIRTTTVNPNPAFEPFESHYKTLSVFPFALPQVLALGCPVQPPLKKLLDVVGVVISGPGLSCRSECFQFA
jgi:hypothetical protein